MLKLVALSAIFVAPQTVPVMANASADDGVTLAATVAPVFGNGQLDGCSIVFDNARHDPQFSQNQLVQVSGSISFYVFPGKEPSVAIKIGVTPIFQGDNAKTEAPKEVYLVNGFKTNKEDLFSSLDAEKPGFRIYGFRMGAQTVEAVAAAGVTGKIRLAYSMRDGGTGAPVEIDLRMKSLNLKQPHESQAQVDAPQVWSECVSAALKESDD